MNTYQLLGATELGLIFGLVAIGVYLTFRIVDFPDLTVDGSFPLGGAVCATMIVDGYNPFWATLMAIGAGMLSGWVTAFLKLKWNILNLLAGILTMTALYSINLRIMGRPNIALLSEETVFTYWAEAYGFNEITILLLLVIVCVFLLIYFLMSDFGLAMRACGINSRMAKAQGINNSFMVMLGLSLSNGISALAGALFAQSQGFADVTMGVGTIIMGLAAVILGETVFPSRRIWIALISCVVGAILYRIVIALALNASSFGLQASDLNLVTAVLVAFAMVIPILKKKLTWRRK